MSEIGGLLVELAALESSQDNPLLWRSHLEHLRDGLSTLDDTLIHLREENHDLKAHRESLEQQVMELASDEWENVVLFHDESEDDLDFDDDPDPDFDSPFFDPSYYPDFDPAA